MLSVAFGLGSACCLRSRRNRPSAETSRQSVLVTPCLLSTLASLILTTNALFLCGGSDCTSTAAWKVVASVNRRASANERRAARANPAVESFRRLVMEESAPSRTSLHQLQPAGSLLTVYPF